MTEDSKFPVRLHGVEGQKRLAAAMQATASARIDLRIRRSGPVPSVSRDSAGDGCHRVSSILPLAVNPPALSR